MVSLSASHKDSNACVNEMTGAVSVPTIKESDGETTRVRVDDQTKMDRVAVGDQVKAYVSEDGYASTIQRDSD
ncbi:hypothetical protein [Nitrospira sp. BLG_2]|uniref:hypothetical protein n=1 Tax=Nitrospira sp. BLG_2 TaxID=3397507 RepID=UPI003B99E4EC